MGNMSSLANKLRLVRHGRSGSNPLTTVFELLVPHNRPPTSVHFAAEKGQRRTAQKYWPEYQADEHSPFTSEDFLTLSSIGISS